MNIARTFLTGLAFAVLAGEASADLVRFATFNASMSRGAEGELAKALQNANDPQIAKVAGIIRAVDPDVILINEFDHDAGRDRTFVGNYLDDGYPFSFIAPSNTGLATDLDLDGDGVAGSEPGTIELAKDSHGFGTFEGQYGMVVLSKHEIALEDVRTFRTFLWKDMPGARLPARPDGSPFHSDEVLEILRLSSKSHWDVPVRVGEAIVQRIGRITHRSSMLARYPGGYAVFGSSPQVRSMGRELVCRWRPGTCWSLNYVSSSPEFCQFGRSRQALAHRAAVSHRVGGVVASHPCRAPSRAVERRHSEQIGSGAGGARDQRRPSK